MLYRRFDINGKDADTLYTELLYAIAVAKTEGTPLLRLVVTCEAGGNAARLAAAAERHMRRLKREGRIRLFLFSERLHEDTTVAAYLLNKYPALIDEGVAENAAVDAYMMI